LQTQQIVRALQHFGAALIIAQISQVIDCQGIIALLQHLSRQAVARVLRFLRAVCKVAQRVEGRNRPRVIASRQQLLRLCIAHLAQALVRILISGNVLQQRSSAVQIARLLQLHSRDIGILLPHGRRFIVGYGGDQQLTRGGIIARLGLFTRQLAAAVVDQLLRVAEARYLFQHFLGLGVIALLVQIHRRLVQAGRGLGVSVQIVAGFEIVLRCRFVFFIGKILIGRAIVAGLEVIGRVFKIGIQLFQQRNRAQIIAALHIGLCRLIQTHGGLIGSILIGTQRQEFFAGSRVVHVVHAFLRPLV